MHQFSQNLLASFDRYIAMQVSHLKSFESKNFSDFEKQAFERASAFEELKTQLTHIKKIRTAKNNSLQILSVCRGKCALIINQNEMITAALYKYRNPLKKYLQRLGQGKKALQGYVRPGTSDRPKFMSKYG